MKQTSSAPHRRDCLTLGSLALGSLAVGGSLVAATPTSALADPPRNTSPRDSQQREPRFCFNTSSLRDQKLPIDDLAKMVAKAGYDGIEVWIDELDRYQNQGGALEDLGKLMTDLGLRVEGAIAFANWLVEDPQQADAEFEKAKRDMEKVAAIGGRAIAAPPVGQNERPIQDWTFAAQRFQRLVEVGLQVGVQPQLELWGFSQAIGNISQLLQLASAIDSRDFGILLDVYHLYKGGSSFNSLRLIHGGQMSLFHINDYPAQPGRNEIADRDRVFPGDGVAPLPQIFHDLAESGFQGALSLELFNPDYWRREATWVLETGLAKSRAAWESRKTWPEQKFDG